MAQRPTSAGLLLFRDSVRGLEVLIVHPGGPFWARRQAGAWSIPKGEFDPESESAMETARREFAEETGAEAPDGPMLDLGETRLKSGKRIIAWAVSGDFDTARLSSNTFELEWPPKSGRLIQAPEVDEARWCTPSEAAELLNPAQAVFVDRLVAGVDGVADLE